jgi:beta-RFAP synthase
VRVEAPARLHLGMLAVAGDSERRFGGFGVSVGRPAVVLEAEPAAELSAEGPDAQRALAFARRCHGALGLTRGAHLRVIEAIPEHVGLGSGTKLALAVAQALATLEGRDADAPCLAEAAGRAARSAVGLWTFELGGLVVEGGHRPGVERPASLLARHPVPAEWRAVLVVPAAAPGLSGSAEDAAFGRLAPAPERSAAIAQLVLTALLPALVEREVEEFGAALTRIQELVGDSFAAAQGGRFHPRSAPLVEALLRFGAAGAGQSSWGPAVYGVVGGEAAGRELARRMEDVVGGEASVELVAFDNRGARVERS